MKIVINRCYGGFSLSPLAIKELAKLNGKDCYFFNCMNKEREYKEREYKELTIEEATKSIVWSAYSVSNPQDYNLSERDSDGLFKSANRRAKEISLTDYNVDRSNKHLIFTIEKLGKKANTRFSDLVVVEIPDGIDYTIEEYDGMEHISEVHRTWS